MSPKLEQRTQALSQQNLNSFHVDPFGCDPQSVKPLMPIFHWLYKSYFRCKTYGISNIPEGRVIVVANHSGQLPFDGLMIGMAFMLELQKPRLLRGMAERWSAELPFVNTLFARGGTVVGEPSACEELLRREEAVMVFPEGVRGISKLYKDRYQLTDFGHGFARLALKMKAPILPVALVGAEDQAPAIAKLSRLGKWLGAPTGFPIVFPQILPFPLPVRYHIHIGKPMWFHGTGREDESIVDSYVDQTKNQIQKMLDRGLKMRKGVFF
ncbi:MAG: acyltransferase family protein [Deltaproteobacteria bacterium]|nr:acyltransferase family protein [Deltaproteobacteria bacterium]